MGCASELLSVTLSQWKALCLHLERSLNDQRNSADHKGVVTSPFRLSRRALQASEGMDSQAACENWDRTANYSSYLRKVAGGSMDRRRLNSQGC